MTNATKEQLLALAERVEQATGPDRHLGREVLVACGKGYVSPLQRWMDPTASLDAALSLVPDRHRWLVDKRPFAESRSDGYRAQVYRQGYYYKSDMSDTPTSWAATPALALTAAALRARAHSQEVK